MYKIAKGIMLSLPQTILLHMYRTLLKGKGQSPYSTMVVKLFQHFHIKLPTFLCVRTPTQMMIGHKMIAEMRLKELSTVMEDI